jgi:hypothetical protein
MKTAAPWAAVFVWLRAWIRCSGQWRRAGCSSLPALRTGDFRVRRHSLPTRDCVDPDNVVGVLSLRDDLQAPQ